MQKSWRRTDKLADGFTFEYYNKATGERNHITLFINPEEFTVTEPARITVTQTKGGAFVDHFGQGLKQVTIRGTTGFNPPQPLSYQEKISGHEHFIQLRKLIRDWQDKAKDPATSKNHIMRFYNWSDQEYWDVAVTQFTLLRAVGRPLLYQYTIVMTVLQDMEKSVRTMDTGFEEVPIFDYLLDPERRVPIVAAKLGNETNYLNNIFNKLMDITGLSSGTQTWGPLIAKGAEVFDTVSGVYRTITSVIQEVDDVTRTLGMYVDGVTSFINTPFESIQNTSDRIEDIIDDLCAVSDIPHELVRSLREMICALRALPSVLFSGFTNPSLFEGNSNCGATLGIPDAPVSIYRNSFEATAQIPAERQVTQAFAEPVKTLILKEQPTQVIGVYLATDISRIGYNYLDSVNGNEITLTSVPSVPVIIDYKVQQDTTTDMLKLQATDGVILKFEDTLERISYDAFGDASQWKLIALYNDLEYPFIVDTDFDKEIEATGYVRFYRNPAVLTPITIPVNSSVWVPIYRGTLQIDFVTTATKVLPIANTYIDVPVQAVKPGEIGNVAPSQITGFTAITGILKVSNVDGVTGGKIWRVMKPGDVILIPKTSTTSTSIISGATKDYDAMFGIDIALTKDGEFDVANETLNDLKRVYGVKNLVQALKDRILTQKRYYIYHPEYGCDLPYYMGRKNITHWQDLVKVDIKGGVLLDPRISEIKQFKMEIDGDTISMDFDAIPINQNAPLPLNLII